METDEVATSSAEAAKEQNVESADADKNVIESSRNAVSEVVQTAAAAALAAAAVKAKVIECLLRTTKTCFDFFSIWQQLKSDELNH